jgi:hypothetical protein
MELAFPFEYFTTGFIPSQVRACVHNIVGHQELIMIMFLPSSFDMVVEPVWWCFRLACITCALLVMHLLNVYSRCWYSVCVLWDDVGASCILSLWNVACRYLND